MISRIYRLVDTKSIELKLRELQFYDDSILVKPDHMTICAADQRYYLGQRKKEVLRQKLPMALIHEATGTVLHDFSGKITKGSKVVLVPLQEGSGDANIKGNYRYSSTFASSNTDGFLCDLIVLPTNRVVSIKGEYTIIYAFTELLSVAINALQAFEATRRTDIDSFGVWGDGNMGFIMSLILRCKYPESRIYVFGKTPRKLLKFSFATKTFYVDQIPDGFSVSHGFECVGGLRSEGAIKQMVDMITPQGVLNLLGVSEEAVLIDTRLILEKGLLLAGSSRSDYNDFCEAASLISENEVCRKYLQILISEIIEVKTEDDIYKAFEQSVLNDFKTVIKWAI